MTENEFSHWAFLCCAEPDNQPPRTNSAGEGIAWGDWWHAALESFSVPSEFVGQLNSRGEIIPARLKPVYRAEPKTPDTATLDAAQRTALEQSRYLVVICSPRAAASARVNETVRYFKQLGRGSRILPIVVAGEPNAAEAECFVPAMRHPLQPDGSLDFSRIERGYSFADARQGRDRREILAADLPLAETELEIARLQLLAGLIGVGFNGLLRREQTRRFTGFAAAQQEARAAQSQIQAAREQAQQAQNQLELFQLQSQATLSQLEAARNEAREAQKKMLESQNLPPDVQSQIQDTQNKFLEAERRTHDAQKRVLELERDARQLEKQAETARDEMREIQARLQNATDRAEVAERQLQTLQNQTLEVRQQLQSAQNRATQAEDEIRKFQNQPKNEPQLPRETPSPSAKRLLRIFAVLAALALFAAGIAGNYAAKQRQRADRATDLADAVTAGKFDLTQDGLDSDHIRAALQKFGGAEPAQNRLQSLDRLAEQIPAASVSNIFEIAGVIADENQRTHFQDRLLDAWAKADCSAAFNWACQLYAPEPRERALAKIISYLPAGDFTNTLDRLSNLHPAPDASVFVRLFQSLDTNALAQAASLPVGDLRADILAGLLRERATTNMPAALAEISALSANEQSAAANQMLAAWAQQNSPAAAQFAGAHPELPAESFREIAFVWSQKDFSAATNWFANLPDGDAKNSALTGLAQAQASATPASALVWLQTLPDTNAPAALPSIIQSWSQTEPAAAARWLADLPPNTNNEIFLDSFIAGAAMKYPAFAAEWTQSVTNDAERQKFQIEVARCWLKTDSAAAINWIDSLNLPEKTRAVLKAPAH